MFIPPAEALWSLPRQLMNWILVSAIHCVSKDLEIVVNKTSHEWQKHCADHTKGTCLSNQLLAAWKRKSQPGFNIFFIDTFFSWTAQTVSTPKGHWFQGSPAETKIQFPSALSFMLDSPNRLDPEGHWFQGSPDISRRTCRRRIMVTLWVLLGTSKFHVHVTYLQLRTWQILK